MGGGGLPTGGQGSTVYVLCAEPKEYKRFRPGARPGGVGFPAGRIGDRVDREIVYVPNAYVPFPTLRHENDLSRFKNSQERFLGSSKSIRAFLVVGKRHSWRLLALNCGS